MSYSIAIYGSYARNDYDIYSDKDVAIFHDDIDISDVVSRYTDNKWSCATYSYRALQRMAAIGSLFVQHIKQDSNITYDNNNVLNSILASYTPKKYYDLKSAISLFSILRYVENSTIGLYWAMDILAVALRNYNILRVANEQVYEFCTDKLNRYCMTDYGLSYDEYFILSQLRIFKYKYRTSNFGHEDISHHYQALLNIINTKFQLSFRSHIVETKEFLSQAQHLLSQEHISGYQRLRLLEMIFNIRKNNLPNEVIVKYNRIITNPAQNAYYFNTILDIEHFVKELLYTA